MPRKASLVGRLRHAAVALRADRAVYVNHEVGLAFREDVPQIQQARLLALAAPVHGWH